VISRRQNQYARLLRWYPQSSRQEHAAIVLDSFEQHANDKGLTRPSLPEAWSIRAHGLAARATSRWAVG
jgi:cytochrome c-type biogenesis protein CcmF